MKRIEKRVFVLRPSEDQKRKIIHNCHNARFAYNWGVSIVQECLNNRQKIPSGYSMAKSFNEFKHQEGYEWLVDSDSSQRATKYALTKQLNKAVTKFLHKQKRSPSYHSKKRLAKMSYYTDDENTRFGEKYVVLEGLGKVKCYHNYDYNDPNIRIADPSIVFTGDRYELWISVVHKYPIKPKNSYLSYNTHNEPIGIDVGLVHSVVTSNGDIYDMPDVSKIDRKIARVDRRISKWYREFWPNLALDVDTNCDSKTKNPEYKSQNLLKLLSKRRKLYRKSVNVRKNFRCQTVSDIVHSNPEAIVIEGLKDPTNLWSIKGNKKLNKRISDSAIGDILNRIKYKCEWLDIPLIIADEWYPSSKRCSCCGNTIDNKISKDRTFVCSKCGYTEDRDLNAAYNLRNLAYEKRITYYDDLDMVI